MARTGLLVDIAPLRESPVFRRLWIGSSLSAVGSQMTNFAVALQVFRLTHSSAAVGGVGLAFALPAILVGTVGGALIDSVDRRQLVLVTSCLQALASVAFVAQAFADARSVALLYGLVAVVGAVGAVNAPARRTFTPRLLRRELMPAAAALSSIAIYVAAIASSGLAGVITASAGLRFCYLIDALTFGASLYGLIGLPSMRPEGDPSGRNLSSVIDGLRFVVDKRALRGALLADLSATVLAVPVALFPAINAERFGGSPRTLGLLGTAIAVGALLGSTLSGPVKHVRYPGRAMLIAGAIWGAALAGFGAVHSLAATLACLAIAGAADVLAVVFRTTIVQLATPDSMRGRVSSSEYVIGTAFPQVGNFRAGLVASVSSPTVSAVSGGLSAVVGAGLIALTLPAFTRYRHADDAIHNGPT